MFPVACKTGGRFFTRGGKYFCGNISSRGIIKDAPVLGAVWVERGTIMLELKNITKTYVTGDLVHNALEEVSICFRKSEFVSVLGQSGSGKTTLLNIVGGLDQYTSGDLVINGVSTKEYKDRDWDNYRNHSIGFVFQSYNLIPHQTVKANVELALTLSGISKAERSKRAEETLRIVGLEDQMNKKPNQMSGGQMQRVAIARALINDPDILLADEPTGALDSETSVQVMDLLKEVSKDRLVIMVTHNPDLAEQYSNRIVRLLDGKIISDSRPYSHEESEADLSKRNEEAAAKEAEEDEKALASGKYTKEQLRKKKAGEAKKAKKKTSMSFFTALSLSFTNLLTKKGRTILTSFAGSIGIIGIALILSVSTGFQMYIDRVQEDTLSSYPITIYAQSVDLSSLISSFAKADQEGELGHELDAVYENTMIYELVNAMNSADVTKNNLKDFKSFVENDPELHKYMSAYQYQYGIDFNIYSKDVSGKLYKSDLSELMKNLMGGDQSQMGSGNNNMSVTMMQSSSSYNVWQEMLPGKDGELISETILEQYEVLGNGRWPEAMNEVVVVVDKNNEISDMVLYSLGLKTQEELLDAIIAGQNGKIIENEKSVWTYDEICSLKFRLFLNPEKYLKNADGTYTDMSKTDAGLDYLYNNKNLGVDLKVVGVIRQKPDAVTGMISGSIAYTKALSDYAIDKIVNSDIVKEQLKDRSVNVITGLPFKGAEITDMTDEEKVSDAKAKIAAMTVTEKAALYKAFMSVPSDAYLDSAVKMQRSMFTREELEAMLMEGISQQVGTQVENVSAIAKYVEELDDETFYSYVDKLIRESLTTSYAAQQEQKFAKMTEEELAEELDSKEFSDEDYVKMHDGMLKDEYSEQTFNEVVFDSLGYVSKDYPSSISLFAVSFENKDNISECINRYNKGVEKEDQISYTDYVKLLMSSITTIINAVTIVLTGFVAISLVVSSIMIGIITYISVLERTKEIGILRAVGASKRDVSRVFTAETLIVGFGAGLMGIIITLLLIIPLNIVLHSLTGIAALRAVLPVGGAVILVLISMFLTFIAGLLPSRLAAKKNPVEALRTE